MAELAYLQVSRVCNQKCVFCSNPENGRVIPWPEAKKLIDRFKVQKAAGVIMTGGEPTMNPGLARLIAYSLEQGLPVRLITNGQKTAGLKYFKSLQAAGLRHMHVSVHSPRAEVQAGFSQNPDSLPNIMRTLDNAGRLGVRVDINTTINRKNAPELEVLARWIVERWPFVRHYVWNNFDPRMNPVSLNPELVPRLRDFEVSLHRAMAYLDSVGRTFRAERVPLCYMSEFPHRSTETRKFVKKEARSIYFLDEKGLRDQDRMSWTYGKCARCRECRLDPVCAGLYEMDVYYSSAELCPSFLSPKEVARRVLEDRDA